MIKDETGDILINLDPDTKKCETCQKLYNSKILERIAGHNNGKCLFCGWSNTSINWYRYVHGNKYLESLYFDKYHIWKDHVIPFPKIKIDSKMKSEK